MTSANAQNAQASTGPKTAHGKARSARNALKHGLTAGEVLLPTEEAGEFNAFSEGLRASLAPVGELESMLVERIVVSAWRWRRVVRLERVHQVYQLEDTADDIKRFGGLGRYSGLSEEGVEGLESEKRITALVNLVRYEGSIERSLYRAMHELERFQAARKGSPVALPVMVDVDVAVGSELPENSDGGDGDAEL